MRPGTYARPRRKNPTQLPVATAARPITHRPPPTELTWTCPLCGVTLRRDSLGQRWQPA